MDHDTFSVSVSRENSQDAVNAGKQQDRASILKNTNEEQGEVSHHPHQADQHQFLSPASKHLSVILSYSKEGVIEHNLNILITFPYSW